MSQYDNQVICPNFPIPVYHAIPIPTLKSLPLVLETCFRDKIYFGGQRIYILELELAQRDCEKYSITALKKKGEYFWPVARYSVEEVLSLVFGSS